MDGILASVGLGDRICAARLSAETPANRPTAAGILLMAEAAGVEWARQEFQRLSDERRFKATMLAAAEHGRKIRKPKRQTVT